MLPAVGAALLITTALVSLTDRDTAKRAPLSTHVSRSFKKGSFTKGLVVREAQGAVQKARVGRSRAVPAPQPNLNMTEAKHNL